MRQQRFGPRGHGSITGDSASDTNRAADYANFSLLSELNSRSLPKARQSARLIISSSIAYRGRSSASEYMAEFSYPRIGHGLRSLSQGFAIRCIRGWRPSARAKAETGLNVHAYMADVSPDGNAMFERTSPRWLASILSRSPSERYSPGREHAADEPSRSLLSGCDFARRYGHTIPAAPAEIYAAAASRVDRNGVQTAERIESAP